MTMTPRSPTTQPKSTTISRRLRNRADQDLSVQPPELPQIRGFRSRRAATLPSTRHLSVNTHPQETHLPVWDPSEILDPFPRSNTTTSGLEEPPSALLSEALDLPPFRSPHPSPDPAPFPSHSHQEHFGLSSAPEPGLLPSPLPSLSGGHPAPDFDLRLSTDPDHSQDPSVELQDMSTLGFMMPAQYDLHYGSPPSLDSPNYPPMNHAFSDSRAPHQPQTTQSYAPPYTSSPSLQSESRRPAEHNILPPYQPSSVPRSPYQQTAGSMRASPTPMSYATTSSEPSPMLSSAPHSYPYPPVHAPLPGQGVNGIPSNSSSYPPPPIYPPTTYEMNGYNPLPTAIYPPSSSAASYPSYEPSPGLAPPTAGLSSSPGSQPNGVMPRVLNSRPKPQCWEHGCNGRQFSTFSNLLRHQREKSGTASKSYCPRCGAEFTRTTARNGHLAHEKCKPRRASDSSR
ncbi:hypothetical protein EJ04DRAFT_561084 [Polyplosphaeria fusca]|uniref:Uncharacterized protein n=1 Tax=Polyplosphaeria fusca TaxID=682080 RepID=A0A9P4V6Z7_9PLEO|nr:hypothetical protein EJ04DRAFT_561084 [Polyplosphaeria fusca]